MFINKGLILYLKVNIINFDGIKVVIILNIIFLFMYLSVFFS